MGAEIFRTCPDRSRGPQNLLYNEYRVFPGGKKRPGRDADPSPFLVPWSRKRRAIPLLLPLWAVRPVQSLNACTSVHLSFAFTLLMFGVQKDIFNYTKISIILKNLTRAQSVKLVVLVQYVCGVYVLCRRGALNYNERDVN